MTLQQKVGDTLTLKIKALSPRAEGIAATDTGTIAVREALPGEEVQAVLTRVRRREAQAQVVKVECAAPQRTAPRCPHFGPCGGCDLQHLVYPAQVEWKRERLTQLFREADIRLPAPIEIAAMEEPWGYRNKIELTFGPREGQVMLGFHERASFQKIVDVTQCAIAPHAVASLAAALKEAANRSGIAAYNSKTHQGFWRYAVIRTARDGRRLMVLVITHEGERAALETMAQWARERIPALSSFSWGISTSISDVAVAERMITLFGPEALEDQTGSLRYHFRPTTFVQPNGLMAEQAYRRIQAAAALTGQEAVYDLYCGIGLIALSLASRARTVIGVESVEENVDFARINAQRNGISNALFFCGKAEDLLKRQALFKAGPRPDLIVLDPPRAGLSPQMVAPLLEAGAPTLLYLSCNPASLTRDLKALLGQGSEYRLEEATLFDFFPHTIHTETLAVLRR